MEQEKCEQSPLYKLRNCVTIWFFIALGAQKEAKLCGVKRSWETIADNLSKAGWSLGWVSALDSHGRTIWIADVHRGDGKRFVARAEEKLTAFLELEAAIRVSSHALHEN
jgi:hypothetical protein